ncbi:MAG: V-type ATP synthase subunit F [Candidatus Thermoplasmatota archaeon]|nr:V-type ATP synthase subunit F [Candidatus Thermoplasmatota archaeon]
MMEENLHAALDDDMALGFSLAGVKDIFIVTDGEGDGGLKEWFLSRLKDEGGLIILSMEAAEGLRDELFTKRARGALLPVVVILPGSGEDSIAKDLVRRAIGMMPHGEGTS